MIVLKFTTWLFLLILSSNSPQVNAALIDENISYRLPNNTVPRLYKIYLEPHIDDTEFTFDGTSSIIFEVLDSTQSVTVHASKLIEIDEAYTRITYKNGTFLTPISQNWDAVRELFSVQFYHMLEVEEYTIEFKWKGKHAPDFRGFYRTSHETTDEQQNAKIEYLAASHFEPTAARAAFPCWDEPGFKAEFDISLKHHTNYTALSNMPVKSTVTTENGKVWTNFERSPPMSTYITAFVVSTLPRQANTYGNLTLWAPKCGFEEMKDILDLSEKAMKIMEEYTCVPYRLPKLDSVLILQSAATAMENWGLIIYGPPRADLSAVAIHEIAHQWFGNLVTPAWWNELWLSESFASYFEMRILDEISGNTDSMDFFYTYGRNMDSNAMVEYGKQIRSSESTLNTQQEINSMFVRGVYKKGPAVITMLEYILTEDVLRNGLRNYLNMHQYGSVVTDDLWDALQGAYSKECLVPHLDIKEMMDPWIEQPGYPLLFVEREYETGVITVTQRSVNISDIKASWMIPINYISRSQPNLMSNRPTHWMSRSSKSIRINGVHKDDWVIFNIQNKGFYRVNYDGENWKRLISDLNSDNYDKIHVINRYQLVYDIIYNLPRYPPYDFELLIDMTEYLYRETNSLPWMPVAINIKPIAEKFMKTTFYTEYSRWMLHVMDRIITRLGFDDNIERSMDSTLRSLLLPWACTFGHRGCRTAATLKLVETLTNNATQSTSANQLEQIYCMGLLDADEAIWTLLMDVYFSNPGKLQAYKYLGCTNNSTLIRKYLNLALTTHERLHANEISLAFTSLITHSPENKNFAIDFFIENYEIIQKHFDEKYCTDAVHSIDGIVRGLAGVITTCTQYEKFTGFLVRKMEEGKMNNNGKMAIQIAEMSLDASSRLFKIITYALKDNTIFRILRDI